MMPQEKFEYWADYQTWVLSFGISFRYKAVNLVVGPYGVQYNWNA